MLYRSRQGFKTLFVGLIIAVVVLFALMPPWWSEPVGGVVRFLESNLSRGKTIPIKVQFLGTTYKTPKQSLPWYNTLVWTVFVTPVGFLVLAGLGLWAALRHWRNESIGSLIAGHWAFLMILRAMPHTPGHDGVRLFLPAFGMLALLAGLGARLSARPCGDAGPRRVIAAALLEGVVSIVVMMPVPLSYFSPIVGGLPGATALGMEPTYYWDALSPEARRWLAEHTSPGRTFALPAGFRTHGSICGGPVSCPGNWTRLTGRPNRNGSCIQNRPGGVLDGDRMLVAQGRPALHRHQARRPLDLDLPVQRARAIRAQRNNPPKPAVVTLRSNATRKDERAKRRNKSNHLEEFSRTTGHYSSLPSFAPVQGWRAQDGTTFN